MKTFLLKRTLLIVFFGFFASASFGSIIAKQDSMDCLEISGMVTINGKPQSDVMVKLWFENEQISTIDLKKQFKFKFILKKNAAYSIIVSRPGFITRLVSISTKLPNDVSTESLFRFYFELELIPEKDSKDPFYADFPTANISYNPLKDAFENDDKYSKNIKKAMLKK
jgi:hypothetical protein